jgi:glycosyltransferase involved in cell wall biosynthesis
MNAATLTASQNAHPATRPLRVVIVDEELPYPPTSGKRIRALNLTLRLARRHRLTYLCHRNADPAEAELAREHFARHGVETVIVDRAVPPRSGLRFFLRLGLNLFSSLPYSVASHNSRSLRRAIRELAQRQPVDLWHCEWSPYAEPLRCLPDACRVVTAQNVESLIWQRYYETETNALKRWYIGRQWRKFRRFEQNTLRGVNRTVAVTAEDAALFERDFGVERVEVVDNGVDTAFYQPLDLPRDPKQLLFLGSLDWRPNLDAVDQLLTHVLPEARRAWPAVTCAIVGRNPPAGLRRRISETPGVTLHADVADVRPYLATSAMLVVPLRIGGGSRLKILEALAMGLPVVSTRIGAEGLCLEDGRHLTVRESIHELVGAVLEALREPATARFRAAEGRRLVRQRYDWDALADRLEEVWLECVAEARRKGKRG